MKETIGNSCQHYNKITGLTLVIQVIILCIIIFFCEKNKSQDKEDYDE